MLRSSRVVDAMADAAFETPSRFAAPKVAPTSTFVFTHFYASGPARWFATSSEVRR